MATIQDLRTAIKEFPEIEEAPKNTSFRQATFRIAGKGCIAIEKNGDHTTFALLTDDIEALIKLSIRSLEPISKSGNLIGVRVNLTELSVPQVKILVKMAHEKSRYK